MGGIYIMAALYSQVLVSPSHPYSPEDGVASAYRMGDVTQKNYLEKLGEFVVS